MTAIVLYAIIPTPAHAETLQSALAAAWAHHPSLAAEIARKRASRAGIDLARSGYLPRLNASGDVGASTGRNGLNTGSDQAGTPLGQTAEDRFGRQWTGNWRAAVSVEQPVYDGNRTSSAVAEARAGSNAAGEQVRGTGQAILLEAATAYAHVLRDRMIERLRARNVTALDAQLRAARTRLERGAGTSTDVSQTSARRDQAAAELAVAKGETIASISDYRRVIGHAPGRLVAPGVPEHALPRSQQSALATALDRNPQTILALHRETAARHAIERLRADRLPQVKLRGGLETERGFQSDFNDRSGASVSLRVVVPLYDGGETAARVRQARHIRAGLAEDARSVRDRVRSNVVAAWARLVAARQRIIAERRATRSNSAALNGILEGIRLGQRTTLEGLDARRELVASQVRVAASNRDLVVSAYAVLTATGQLTPDFVVGGSRPTNDKTRASSKAAKATLRPVKTAPDKVRAAASMNWRAVTTLPAHARRAAPAPPDVSAVGKRALGGWTATVGRTPTN